MTDLGGDYQNLYKLIYSDITSSDVRDRVLKHCKAQADLMTSESGSYGLKILSDVDDTLYSSGGKFPAGRDREYPKHQLYPGCLEFFKVRGCRRPPKERFRACGGALLNPPTDFLLPRRSLVAVRFLSPLGPRPPGPVRRLRLQPRLPLRPAARLQGHGGGALLQAVQEAG